MKYKYIWAYVAYYFRQGGWNIFLSCWHIRWKLNVLFFDILIHAIFKVSTQRSLLENFKSKLSFVYNNCLQSVKLFLSTTVTLSNLKDATMCFSSSSKNTHSPKSFNISSFLTVLYSNNLWELKYKWAYKKARRFNLCLT